MSGIGDVVIRQITRTLTKKGVEKAMKAGKRMAGKKGKKGGGEKEHSDS